MDLHREIRGYCDVFDDVLRDRSVEEGILEREARRIELADRRPLVRLGYLDNRLVSIHAIDDAAPGRRQAAEIARAAAHIEHTRHGSEMPEISRDEGGMKALGAVVDSPTVHSGDRLRARVLPRKRHARVEERSEVQPSRMGP